MRKVLSLTLAVLMLLSLLAGCGNKPAEITPSTPAKTDVPVPTEEASPYHYPIGKYEKNEAGYPASKYVYETPICTNDEILTKWTTCYTPQYIPSGGWDSIPTWKGVREYTGVHIEYNIVDSANRSQNFSVLLASDALDEICDQGAYFYQGGSLKDAVEDGYFVNLYPYRDYMPCYLYEAYTRSLSDKDVMSRIYYDKETIISLTGMIVEPAPGMGYFVREDWLREMNLGSAAEIKTYAQLHDVLLAMKRQYSSATREIFPFFINNCVENAPGCFFGGFGTAVYTTRMSYMRVNQDVVEFCGTTEDDRDAMTLLSTWYSEGLISPNFQAFVPGEDYDAGANTNGLGCNLMPPSAWLNTEAQGKLYDPDCQWEPITRPKKTSDQILQYGGGNGGGFHYGSAVISGNCHNIPLAVSWLDWWMSETGSEWTSWGPEGENDKSVGFLWYYNENAERRLTDWCMNNEAGMAWIMCLYGCNGLVEFCLQIHKRNYAFDGGERSLACFEFWEEPDYEGKLAWPSAVKLSDEESAEAASILSDLNTYYVENYAAFVDGSKPMSSWDSYLKNLNSFGYQRLREIYQAAYDRYLAE